jgi:signal peptidase I
MRSPIVATVLAFYLASPAEADESLRSTLFGFEVYKAHSRSMEPTIHVGELVLADTDAYKKADPARGQVVAYKNRKVEGNIFIMRIVALGGDTIQIRDGQLLVNGTIVREPYVDSSWTKLPHSRTLQPVSVPDSMVFVLGDARDVSNDSRFLGPVPVEDLAGHVTMVTPAPGSTEIRDVR